MNRLRRSFTLLEMLIVLTVLGMAATAVGWHLTKLIAHHRFQAAGATLCAALEEAQAIAIIHRTECEMILYAEKGDLKYQFKTHEPRFALSQVAKKLHGVDRVTQENVVKESGRQKRQELRASSLEGQKISFVIRSSGRIEPPGILGLHPSPSAEESIQSLWVDLQTPLQIYLKTSEPSKKKESLPAPVSIT